LLEAFALLDYGFGALPAKLCENASLNVDLSDLFLECLFERVRLDIESESFLRVGIIDPVRYLLHHPLQFFLVVVTQSRVRAHVLEVASHLLLTLLAQFCFPQHGEVRDGLPEELVEIKRILREEVNC
jgi:hypothetical protein